MSEVSASLQPDTVLFSRGERDPEEKLGGRGVQSLDAMLDRSPRHAPRYTTRKGFNGKTVFMGTNCLSVYSCCASQSFDCDTASFSSFSSLASLCLPGYAARIRWISGPVINFTPLDGACTRAPLFKKKRKNYLVKEILGMCNI